MDDRTVTTRRSAESGPTSVGVAADRGTGKPRAPGGCADGWSVLELLQPQTLGVSVSGERDKTHGKLNFPGRCKALRLAVTEELTRVPAGVRTFFPIDHPHAFLRCPVHAG